jgi:hypothetical protein
MQTIVSRTSAVAALLLLSLSLGGCVVTARPAYYGGAVVAVAPPAPQVEVYGAPPVAGYIWTGGYWRWTGERHVWVAGQWRAPRPGFRWVEHRWVRGPGGYHFEEGHWAHR